MCWCTIGPRRPRWSKSTSVHGGRRPNLEMVWHRHRTAVTPEWPLISQTTRQLLVKSILGSRFDTKTHVFRLMSLHYLAKLEMLIATIELLQKGTPEFIPPQQSGLQIRQIWIQVSTVCGTTKYCKRRSTKYASLIWTNWNSEREPESWAISLRQPFISGASIA